MAAAIIREIEDSDTPTIISDSIIWDEIELAESFLVSCMYEEAYSKSSSVLRRVANATSLEIFEETELLEIKEAAGMVLIQSLKELGRSRDIVDELMQQFGRVTAIPIEVLLAGACIQISEDPSRIHSFLEDFLSKWTCVDENHYVIKMEPSSPSHEKKPDGTLALDKYMEIVELYTVVLLGKVLNTADVAISWVEKAEIPETNRKDLLRKLHSLYALKTSNTVSQSQTNEQKVQISSQHNLQVFDGSPEASKAADVHVPKQSILKLSSGVEPCFWFFRSVTLRFGKIRLVVTTTKVLVTCLICLLVYAIKKKRQALFRAARKQVTSLRKAMVDLWQLAFSYQVNPLAAVQPLPAATRSTG